MFCKEHLRTAAKFEDLDEEIFLHRSKADCCRYYLTMIWCAIERRRLMIMIWRSMTIVSLWSKPKYTKRIAEGFVFPLDHTDVVKV